MKLLQTTLLGFALLTGGLTLCGFALWLLLSPLQYQATARIKIGSFGTDISGMDSPRSFDPYFIQTAFEIIKSEIVLGDVVTNLNLNELWGKKYGNNNPMKTVEIFKRLQQHLSLEPVFNAGLIDISFIDNDPDEAAKIANAIAAAYMKWRKALTLTGRATAADLETLQRQYDKEENQIQTMRTNVNGLPAQLDQLLERHRLLSLKLAAAKVDASLPIPPDEITNLAVPPKLPLSRNDPLAISLFGVGLFPSVAGWLMLKSSRQSNG